MITKHNWFKTNLDLRTKENVNKFEVSIKPYYFNEEDFNASAARVVHELSIAHNDLYLCYSGGLDSEFVLKVFLENDRKITPVILSTPFNQTELEYAWKFCDNHNVVPVVLQYDKKSILEQLSQKTLLNGYVERSRGLGDVYKRQGLLFRLLQWIRLLWVLYIRYVSFLLICLPDTNSG